jgi:hypothetical protein
MNTSSNKVRALKHYSKPTRMKRVLRDIGRMRRLFKW